jgi:hypothetical protein
MIKQLFLIGALVAIPAAHLRILLAEIMHPLTNETIVLLDQLCFWEWIAVTWRPSPPETVIGLDSKIVLAIDPRQ